MTLHKTWWSHPCSTLSLHSSKILFSTCTAGGAAWNYFQLSQEARSLELLSLPYHMSSSLLSANSSFHRYGVEILYIDCPFSGKLLFSLIKSDNSFLFSWMILIVTLAECHRFCAGIMITSTTQILCVTMSIFYLRTFRGQSPGIMTHNGECVLTAYFLLTFLWWSVCLSIWHVLNWVDYLLKIFKSSSYF